MEANQQPEASLFLLSHNPSSQLSVKCCAWRLSGEPQMLSRSLSETYFTGPAARIWVSTRWVFNRRGSLLSPSAHTLIKLWSFWQRKQSSSPSTAPFSAGQTKHTGESGMDLVLFHSQAGIRPGSPEPWGHSWKSSTDNMLTYGAAPIQSGRIKSSLMR